MILKSYTLDELSNENNQIIIESQEGVSIGIQATPEGTRLYFYYGNEVVKREFDTIVKPVEMPEVNICPTCFNIEKK